MSLTSTVPPEIWQIIFSNLSAPDLSSTELVCKLFRNICSNNYFLSKYKYTKFIEDSKSWKQGKTTGWNGSPLKATPDNNKKIHQLALCVKYNDLPLFTIILKELRQTKECRIPWTDLYRYAGEGGNIKTIQFLQKKCKLGPTHMEELTMGAIKGSHVHVLEYLKDNVTDYTKKIYNRSSYVIINYVCESLRNNNIKVYKYLIDELQIRISIDDLVRNMYSYLPNLVRNRYIEPLKILSKSSRFTNEFNYTIRRLNTDDICWIIHNNIVDISRLYQYITITDMLELIDNDYIKVDAIDWDTVVMDKLGNHKLITINIDTNIFKKIIIHVSDSFNWTAFVKSLVTHRSIPINPQNVKCFINIINIIEETTSGSIDWSVVLNNSLNRWEGPYKLISYLYQQTEKQIVAKK